MNLQIFECLFVLEEKSSQFEQEIKMRNKTDQLGLDYFTRKETLIP